MYQKNDNVRERERERERVLKNLIWFCLIYCTSSWTQIWIIVDSSKGEGLKSQVCNCSQLKIQICWFSKRTEHYIIDKSSRPKTTAASGVSSCLAPLLKGQCTLSLFFCYFLPNSLSSNLPCQLNSTLMASILRISYSYGITTRNSHVLYLTQNATFSIGRDLYHTKIPRRSSDSTKILPFSTSFTFTITQYKNYLPVHDLVFIFMPSTGIQGAASAQHVGFLKHHQRW